MSQLTTAAPQAACCAAALGCQHDQALEDRARDAERTAWERTRLSDAELRRLEAGRQVDDPLDGRRPEALPASVLRGMDPGASLAA
ncbi:hypothetical protein PU560_07120, partial [Georgenia sp. 10Sc9-8]|nr:hypothetical protein [Georgenia halotolerans]